MDKEKDTTFRFRRFSLRNSCSAMKVGTDGVLLGAWADVFGAKRIVDVGAGTGLISLMLAQRAPEAEITGVEIDPEAAAEATANVADSPWPGRVVIVQADIADVATRFRDIDLIVSNPPFFNTRLVSPSDRRALARHEGSLSFEFLLRFARKALSEQGRLAFIAPADRTPDILLQAAVERLEVERVVDVVTVPGKEAKRRLWQFARTVTARVEGRLVLRNPDGTPSAAYKSLTADFYL